MAVMQSTYHYDASRDMQFFNENERYAHEKEMSRRRQEEEYRRMQNAYYDPKPQQVLVNTAPKPDLNDPLGFLSKTDTKILLTGEAS